MGEPIVTIAPEPVANGGLLGILFAVARPEFRDGVPGCERSAWTWLLCPGHYQRWARQGQGRRRRVPCEHRTGHSPQRVGPGRRVRSAKPRTPDTPRGRLLQRRHDDRGMRVMPSAIRHLVTLLAGSGVRSLLDRPLDDRISLSLERGWRDPTTSMIRYAYRELTDVDGIDLEAEYDSDVWVASRLGINVRRAPLQIRFDQIAQPWLRRAVKRWVRHRLGSGKGFGTTAVDIRAMVWFGQFLAERHRGASNEATLGRRDLEAYLSFLVASPLAGHTMNTYFICLRTFFVACRRHAWLPALDVGVALYIDDLPRRPQPLPRYITEFVMGQLEAPESLDGLPDRTTRTLVVVLMEAGLRANNACALSFDALVEDSGGGPCLRYLNAKMGAEQLVPLSAVGAAAVRDQQSRLRIRWPSGPVVLFPAADSNPDGVRAFNYATLRDRLMRWQDTIDLRDEAGRSVRISAHRFRHTFGTRLINQGVPQHVVQRLLGHASPKMTARYATLHDSTVREAFDTYWSQRVNVLGESIAFDPHAPTAEAEWTKHRLARVQATLPNGYCGRPPQQDCPHPNACLTCPDFQTTPEFLDIHRRQHAETRQLLASADADGRFRLAANHRRVLENLGNVITALESPGDPWK